jgi:hypothetical protein
MRCTSVPWPHLFAFHFNPYQKFNRLSALDEQGRTVNSGPHKAVEILGLVSIA